MIAIILATVMTFLFVFTTVQLYVLLSERSDHFREHHE